MNLAQRLDELAQHKAEEEAADEEEDDVYEDEHEDRVVESRQSIQHGSRDGRSRNIGRANEMKSTRGNVKTQDDDEEADMEEEVDEESVKDHEGNNLFYLLSD